MMSRLGQRSTGSCFLRTAAIAAMGIGILGCESDGISPRDQGGMNYPRYAMVLADMSALSSASMGGGAATATGAPVARPQIAPPIRVAVAQFGEVAPPDVMLDSLRKEPLSFAAVSPVSGLVDQYYRGY